MSTFNNFLISASEIFTLGKKTVIHKTDVNQFG